MSPKITMARNDAWGGERRTFRDDKGCWAKEERGEKWRLRFAGMGGRGQHSFVNLLGDQGKAIGRPKVSTSRGFEGKEVGRYPGKEPI